MNRNISSSFGNYNMVDNDSVVNTADNYNITDNPSWSPNSYIYTTVMSIVYALGLGGNLLTILVFSRKEHRSKIITPFIINLAIADVLLVLFGYSVTIIAIISGHPLLPGTSKCIWSAVINGSVGITTIVILTEMSAVICYTVTTMTTANKTWFPTKVKIVLIGFAWIYGIGVMIPPLAGISSFVPGSARISCAPNWTSPNKDSFIYNIVLVVVGFVLPLTVIVTSYVKLYRCVATSFLRTRRYQTGQRLERRRKSLVRVGCMIAVSVVAFVISWSPYCIVCLAAMFQKTYIISDEKSMIPELMAKALVIYNPLIYLSMDRNLRRTLKTLWERCGCHRRDGEDMPHTQASTPNGEDQV